MLDWDVVVKLAQAELRQFLAETYASKLKGKTGMIIEVF